MRIVVLICVLAEATSARAEPPAVEDPRLVRAMRLYAKRATIANHVEAARFFAEIAADHPTNREAQIWCARTAYYCAHRYREQKEEMARIARWSNDCGQRLREKFPGDYEAELWAILARFKWVAADSFIPPLGEIEDLVRRLEAMAAAEPKQYGAYILLGAVFRELPGWPISIGDEDKSLAYLRRAVAIVPTNAELLLELAASYRALDRIDEARAAYQKCIREGDGPPDLIWESAEARTWAEKMLAELD